MPQTHARIRSIGAAVLLSLAGAEISAQSSIDLSRDPASDPPAPAPDSGDVLVLDEYVVTGASDPGALTKMQSSISVSTLGFEQIQVSVPRNTAEIFRSLPAVRSEATAGDSNTNITARGLPLSTGGSQYVQLQEDGVPVLQFGDIAFATADTFLRADSTIAAIESVRGGSASTAATSGPGGVINLLSKNGEVAGGSMGLTYGLDFDSTRFDFEYGSPLGEDISFHVGGFYRVGEGSRRTGFSGHHGGQLKFNLTRRFERGHVRFFLKALDDTGPTYAPMPVLVTGSDSNPTYRNAGSFNRLRDTQYTPFLTRDLVLDADGNPVSSDVTRGVTARSLSVGVELDFTVGDGWHITDRLNFADNSGRFITPFPAEAAAAQDLADAIGGPGATLWYATGIDQGEQVTAPASLNGNGLLTRIHLFNTSLNDMGNAFNNLRVAKTFELGDDSRINTGFGFNVARQRIDQDWNWNSYLLEVAREANLVDVRAAPVAGEPAVFGELRTERGQIAYGVPAWGWFARKYDLTYDIESPYANVSYVTDKFTIDVSVRRDRGEVHGAKYDATPTRPAIDMNGDGVISYIESVGVQRIDVTRPAPIVNYDFAETAFSGGVNYGFTRNLALFGRYSEGFAIRADRLLDAGNVLADGSIPTNDVAFNTTKQIEAGVKYRPESLVPGNLAFFVTLFNAKTNEANSEAAVGGPPLILRDYNADGVEFETAWSHQGFDLRANFTWTDAEITGANDPSVIGNRPRRQANFVYSLSPSYRIRNVSLGLSFIGTTSAYTQDSNQLVMPGYTYVNAHAGVQISEGLSLGLSVNNLFDADGFSEAEEGSIPASGIVRARSIPGRTTSVTLRYAF